MTLGIFSWVTSNNCTSSLMLWVSGTFVIDRRITMQSGSFPRPPSNKAGWLWGWLNHPYPSLCLRKSGWVREILKIQNKEIIWLDHCLFFLSFVFWCGLFLKSLLNLLQYCFCFMFWFLWSRGMWDLSCPAKDQTQMPCIGRWSLKQWNTKEDSDHCFFNLKKKYAFN